MRAGMVRLWALALSAVAALAVTALPASAVGPASSGTEAVGCYLEHRVTSSYPDGFIAEVAITNVNTTSPITNWNLRWTFATTAQIEHVWNATSMQIGAQVTVIPAPWNEVIAPGGTVKFGYLALGSYQPGPSVFTLNGTECLRWMPPPPAS